MDGDDPSSGVSKANGHVPEGSVDQIPDGSNASITSKTDEELGSKKNIPEGYTDILDNGELLKKVIKQGDENAPRPQRGWRVTVNLSVHNKDNPSVLLGPESGSNVELFVGDYDSFSGIDLIIPLMNPGEICHAIIGPRFAYAENGNKVSGIPPNATLEAQIELISAEFVEDLDPKDSLRIATKKKDRGNFWYAREDFSTAIQCYKRSEEFLKFYTSIPIGEDPSNIPPEISELKDQLSSITATVYNNLAAAQLKMGADRAALESVKSSLEHEPLNFKALYRKGKILENMGNVSDALDAYKKALTVEPDSKLVAQEVARLSAKKRQEYNQEKELYKRMIDGLKKGDGDKSNGKVVKGNASGTGLLTAVSDYFNLRWAWVGSSFIALGSALLAYQLYQAR